MSKKLLNMIEVEKSFPGVKALDKANLDLYEGEIIGLIGENGAGKSTLMNILGGVLSPDAGKIFIDDKEVKIKDVLDAQNRGIAFIHQELALEMHMSVAENIFLGRELKKNGMISQRLMNTKAKKYLEIVGLDLEPSIPVHRLSTGQQQMLEIAKAFSMDARIIVMDEPTSSLSEKEVTILVKTIKELRKRKVGIIYISHKLNEIFELTNRIVIMRDGQYIDTTNTSDTNTDELVRLMVGRELNNYYNRTYNELGEVKLQADEIKSGNKVNGCSFNVRKGEIVGFYGLVGSGRSELMQVIMGIDPMDSGKVTIGEKEFINPRPAQMSKEKLVMVPESRKTQGLMLTNTVMFNSTLAVLDKFIGNLRHNSAKEEELAEWSVDKLAIKTPSIFQRVNNLSGGNQQKVVLAKWLLTNPEILIMDEPTRGIDVGAKAEIYSIMNKLVQDGIAVIMVSSELNEIINMCDRLYVMKEGQIVAELLREDFEQNTILHAAFGRGN